MPEYFEHHYLEYKAFMIQSNFLITLAHHSEDVIAFVDSLSAYISKSRTFNVFRDQVRTKSTPRAKTDFIDELVVGAKYKFNTEEPDFKFLNKHSHLAASKVYPLSVEQAKTVLDLKRNTFEIKPVQKQSHNLYLRFTNVDTEELKDLEVKFDGNLS